MWKDLGFLAVFADLARQDYERGAKAILKPLI